MTQVFITLQIIKEVLLMQYFWRRVLVYLVVCAAISPLWAQTNARISYFTKAGTLASDEDAFYYRKSTDTLNFFRSYYVKSQTPYFIGKILKANDSTDQKNVYAGCCQWFYKNGNLQRESCYDENGALNGISKDYYENGNLAREILYAANKRVGNTYTEYSLNRDKIDVTEDNFSSNNLNWLLSQNDSANWKLKLGGLECLGKKEGLLTQFPTLTAANTPISVEVTINTNYLDANNKAGLVFAYKDQKNYGYFLISNRKIYIGYLENGKLSTIVEGWYEERINAKGWNKVGVTLAYDKVFYAINNTFIYANAFKARTPIKIGLGAQLVGAVLFDNFYVRQYANTLPIELAAGKDCLFILEEDYNLSSISTGVILDKSGLILTNYTPFETNAPIKVQAYIGDSIQTFQAKLVAQDAKHNLALLRISDLGTKQLHEPYYSFWNKAGITDSKKISVHYFVKNGKYTVAKKSSNGLLKPASIKEGFTNRASIEGIDRLRNLLGAGVFSAEGELIGCIQETRLNLSLLTIPPINNFLFYSKEPMSKSETVIPELIFKNIVNIRVQ